MTAPLTLLFVGDVVGETGRLTFARAIAELREELQPDLVVVNAENSADSGVGVSAAAAAELLAAGADVLTTGNHAFDGEGADELLASELPVVRPQNYPAGRPGRGHLTVAVGETRIGVLNLASADLEEVEESPLLMVDRALEQLQSAGAATTLIDIHGAWPAEKQALARHVDGRACAVLGTHTHVPTADATVLPGGTAVIADVGMTGAAGSLIGFEPRGLAGNLAGHPIEPIAAVSSSGVLMAVVIELHGNRARSIERVERRVDGIAAAALGR